MSGSGTHPWIRFSPLWWVFTLRWVLAAGLVLIPTGGGSPSGVGTQSCGGYSSSRVDTHLPRMMDLG